MAVLDCGAHKRISPEHLSSLCIFRCDYRTSYLGDALCILAPVPLRLSQTEKTPEARCGSKKTPPWAKMNSVRSG